MWSRSTDIWITKDAGTEGTYIKSTYTRDTSSVNTCTKANIYFSNIYTGAADIESAYIRVPYIEDTLIKSIYVRGTCAWGGNACINTIGVIDHSRILSQPFQNLEVEDARLKI